MTIRPARESTDFEDALTFEPLRPGNWGKFEALFGPRGACGNCWCMYYRRSPSDFREGKADDGNKLAMKELVWSGKPAGLLALIEGEAIGWCAFAPREDFDRLRRSRVHKPIDDKEVWSIPFMFIRKDMRKHGISVEFLKGVIAWAREEGIRIIEAYPTIPTKGMLPDSFAWIGLYSSFQKAGFCIADRTSPNRPMVRFCL